MKICYVVSDKGQRPKSYSWTTLFISLRLFIQTSQIQLTPSYLPISISPLIISAFFFFNEELPSSSWCSAHCHVFSEFSQQHIIVYIFQAKFNTKCLKYGGKIICRSARIQQVFRYVEALKIYFDQQVYTKAYKKKDCQNLQ